MMASLAGASASLLSSVSCLCPSRFLPLQPTTRACLHSRHFSVAAAQGTGRDDAPGMATSRRGLVLGAGSLLGLGLAVGPETSARTAIACDNLTVAPNGLAFCDTSVGGGLAASKGLLIKAHYRGTLEDGTVFDSSYTRGKPLVFRVGVGEVIKGWDQGIAGAEGIPPMLAGGKRTLRIPPELGYGDRGAGCRGGSCIIPPKSVLIFDVEFLGKA